MNNYPQTSEPQSFDHPLISQSYENAKLASFNNVISKDPFQDLLHRFSTINISHRETLDKNDIFNFLNSKLFLIPATAMWSLFWFTSSFFEKNHL